jgi:hypothetical protein
MRSITEEQLERIAERNDADYGTCEVPKNMVKDAAGYEGEQYYDLTTYFNGYIQALKDHGITVETATVGFTHSISYGEIDKIYRIKEAAPCSK